VGLHRKHGCVWDTWRDPVGIPGVGDVSAGDVSESDSVGLTSPLPFLTEWSRARLLISPLNSPQ
jgi:hypothetical protein